jgi:SAM-dependent methyltransferase
MILEKINERYSELAESNCCLSCGGAINYINTKEGYVCVDLGSGRGTDVLRIAEEVGTTGFVYGIDVSEGMLEKARKNAEKLNIKNVKFIYSELEDISLESNIADIVISNCTINHAENKEKVWKEIFRILKEGGRFVVSDIYSTTDVPEEYSKDPVAISECWGGAIRKDLYMETVRKAGFENIIIYEESKPYDKGSIQVVSFTISGEKSLTKSCCC